MKTIATIIHSFSRNVILQNDTENKLDLIHQWIDQNGGVTQCIDAQGEEQITYRNTLLIPKKHAKETFPEISKETVAKPAEHQQNIQKEPKHDWFTLLTDHLRDYSEGCIWTDGNQFLCSTKDGADTIADLIKTLYRTQRTDITLETGYYDPETETVHDRYTNWYYVLIK